MAASASRVLLWNHKVCSRRLLTTHLWLLCEFPAGRGSVNKAMPTPLRVKVSDRGQSTPMGFRFLQARSHSSIFLVFCPSAKHTFFVHAPFFTSVRLLDASREGRHPHLLHLGVMSGFSCCRCPTTNGQGHASLKCYRVGGARHF